MSIFNESDDDIVTIDDSVDYVDQLVGDGKKFKDVKELAKGKAEADRYIELLKQKLDEASKEINTRTSLDTFLKEIKTAKEPVQNQQPSIPEGGQKHELDDSELEKRLEEFVSKRESRSKVQSNLEKVQTVLKDQYGSNAKSILTNKAKELGMSLDRLESIAAESPSAFYRLVGVDEQRNSVAPVLPRSGLNPTTAAASGIRNKAYYDKLKQTDPKKYFDSKTTVEMIKDRKACEAKGYSWE